MNSLKRMGMLLLWGIGLYLLVVPSRAFGYPVPPLPDDNLINNPWFRSASDPRLPGLDGWINVLQNGIGWGDSQKVDNPSPEIVIAGKCGFKEVYCGTSARWANETAEKEVTSYPGVDVYLYQVVKSDPSHRKLKFFMYWVNHKLDVFEVKIYGSETPDGSWQDVWSPFFLTQDFTPGPGETPGHGGLPWLDTGILDAVFEKGYSYYKIEFHARYPEADTSQGDVGVKFTGVYFASELTDANADEVPNVLVINATQPVTSQNSDRPGDQSTPPVKPDRTRIPTATQPIVTPQATRPRPTQPPTEMPPTLPPTTAVETTAIPTTSSLKPLPLASLAAGLLVLVVVIFAVLARRRSN